MNIFATSFQSGKTKDSAKEMAMNELLPEVSVRFVFHQADCEKGRNGGSKPVGNSSGR